MKFLELLEERRRTKQSSQLRTLRVLRRESLAICRTKMKAGCARDYFLKDSIYRLKKDTKVGFQRDSEIQAGTKIRFTNLQYSHYDGYYACHFLNEETKEKFELWIQDELTKEELEEGFELIQ
ncbi:hypothetical protein [Pelagicoccus sp. SDUM812005]|uniref:hypothetical protein n=1 Tax=Pelagicoccus sp. SDUM812005 TaxID=3041257 RepID=UPI00280CC091|nr:hypothetical protein [Pelagicoccus sp. SDUM812005]MDQ8182582.1 hypothetical protein [Pelagicoccus sp. SDUM812005]